MILSIKDAHRSALDEILSALDKKIENWTNYLQRQYPGTSIDETTIEAARDVIRKRSIHIGKDVSETKVNKPLMDTINKLQISRQGNIARFDVETLKQVRFPEQPYDAIEKALAIRRSGRSTKAHGR
jgi:hypothetical protein